LVYKQRYKENNDPVTCHKCSEIGFYFIEFIKDTEQVKQFE